MEGKLCLDGNIVVRLLTEYSQDAFTENYLTAQKQYVFSDVGVLIYVFDIESREVDKDLDTYIAIIQALEEFSPKACVFCMIHKMDLVQIAYRESLFEEREETIKKNSNRFARHVISYPTTIWDQSLYRAWGNIVNSLIPNLPVMDTFLKDLANAIEAEEVVLFERTTFLTVTSHTTETGDSNPYVDRYERLSNIIKTFKHSLASVNILSSSPELKTKTIIEHSLLPRPHHINSMNSS